MKQNGDLIHLYLQISVSSLRCFTEIKIQPAVGSFSPCIIWNVHTTKILLSLRYNFTKIQLHCTRGSLRLCIIQNCRVIKWKSVLSIFMFHKALRNNSHKLRYILLLFYYKNWNTPHRRDSRRLCLYLKHAAYKMKMITVFQRYLPRNPKIIIFHGNWNTFSIVESLRDLVPATRKTSSLQSKKRQK